MSPSRTPVRAVLFDYGHTLVDFQRTQEALHAAYEQIRARIEAVAYMEVPELLDLVERVAGGVDRLVTQSYEQRRMEELDQAQLFRESFAAIGFDLPADVIEHVVALDHSAYSNSITIEPEVLDALRSLRDGGLTLGLVSNVSLAAAPDARRTSKRLELAPLLDAAVFSSEVGVRKPDPRIFRTALERVGAEAGRDGLRRRPAVRRRRAGPRPSGCEPSTPGSSEPRTTPRSPPTPSSIT